jgi:iron complex transport system substrate-binding protein
MKNRNAQQTNNRERTPDSATADIARHTAQLLVRGLFLVIAVLIPAIPPDVYAAGGREAGSVDQTRTITDGLGREVTVPVDPRRIVTAGRAVMMTANTLWAFESAPDRVVGVGRITQGRGNFLPLIDPNYGDLVVLERNVGPEQVASLAPDLVILKSVVRSSLGEPLERLGIPVVYVDLENPEQYQRDLAVLGTVVREEDRARELQRYFLATTGRIMERTVALDDDQRPSTLLIYYRTSGGETAFNVPPAGWMQTQLVEMAGGNPVWREANPGGGWGTVSFEQIAAWDPEVIVLVEYDGNGPEIRSRLENEPRWRELRAVRNDRFHAMPLDHYS